MGAVWREIGSFVVRQEGRNANDRNKLVLQRGWGFLGVGPKPTDIEVLRLQEHLEIGIMQQSQRERDVSLTI